MSATPSHDGVSLHLSTLGALRLSGPDGELLAGRRKELALLAIIACRSPRPVTREELATLFWGDRTDERARHSLRQALLRLRRTVGPGLEAGPDSVVLSPDSLRLDVASLEKALARERLDDAIDLWRGDFLAGCDGAGGEEWLWWVESERERLRRLLTTALERRVERARSRGDWADALAYATARADLFPLDEPAAHDRIRALRDMSRITEALHHHDAFVARLMRELELEPSPAFMALRTTLEADRAEKPAVVRTPGSVALFTPAMIGRDPALAELHAGWNAVAAGGSATIIVEGESGVGKTLLCETFLDEVIVATDPSLVLRARAAPDGAAAQAALRDMLEPLAGAPGLGGVADATLATVAQLVPSIRVRYPRLPEPRADDMRAAVLDTLAMIAEEVAIVVFVDDAALMDDESRTVLVAIAQAALARVLVILTLRPGSESSALLRQMAAMRDRRHLRLAPLTPEELDALVHSMLELPAADRRALTARLHAESRGNPQYAIEIVFALVEEHLLAPDAQGIWRAADGMSGESLPLPHGVRATVRRRLQALSDPAREVAAAIAVIGDVLDGEMLADVLAWDHDVFDAALEDLLARRLLRESHTHAGRYEFVHPLVRRVTYDAVPQARRRALHRAAAARLAQSAAADPAVAAALEFHSMRAGAAHGQRGRRTRYVFAAAALVLVLAAAFALRLARAGAAAPSLIAIGMLNDLRAPGDDDVAPALVDMLATNLARVPGIRIVSNARMYELLGQPAEIGAQRVAWTGAARRAGAVELLEGSLLALPSGRLRLDVRRVDLASGAVRHATSVEGGDAFELVDLATVAVANGMGLTTTPLRVVDATTGSLVAYRFYEEGLRHFAIADYRGAIQLFDAAAAEDSAFALALYYAWRTRIALGLTSSDEAVARMLRLAETAPDRDRLMIRGTWALQANEPLLTAVAETLAIRYPGEPEGQYLVGIARFWSGDFAGALDALENVVALDSLGLAGERPRCLACDALDEITTVYIHMDSLARSERVARDWLRAQPASARAWDRLAAALLFSGQTDSAIAARRHASELNPVDHQDALFPAIAAIYSGDFAAADRMLRDRASTAVPDVQEEALWFLAISLRTQGRLAEALDVERRRIAMRPRADEAVEGTRRHEAQILFELGRYAEAADHVRFAAATTPAAGPTRTLSFTARQHVLNLTLFATALAAAGDTAALPALADSSRAWGERSAFGRDRRLHHHARGLLFVARGDMRAAAAAFRSAMFSTTSGYTRTSLELGRALIAIGDADGAVRVLEPALRGPLESSNLYVTRTELRELLGRALEAAGERDSAAAVYRRVLADWRNADAVLHARRDSVALRLDGLVR